MLAFLGCDCLPIRSQCTNPFPTVRFSVFRRDRDGGQRKGALETNGLILQIETQKPCDLVLLKDSKLFSIYLHHIFLKNWTKKKLGNLLLFVLIAKYY